MKKIALIDNYDSFTWNLVHLFEKSGEAKVDVFLNDKVTIEQLDLYPNLLISPGPGLPKEAGITPRAIASFHQSKNIFGVCLGMQALAEFFGARLKNLRTVMHGIATPVIHSDKSGLFRGVPEKFLAGRYHSWVVDREGLSPELEVIATDEGGELMAMRHRHLNIYAVQFHPESILSEHGDTIAANWLATLS